MDLPEARLIARHHLGEHLRDVIPVGSGYNVLIHLGDGGYRGAFASEAEDLPAVCQEAAAQLRATGWVPTHARLEWEPRPARTALSEDGNQEASANLRLHVGTIRPLLVLWIRQEQGDVWTWPGWDVRGKLPEVLKAVADYVAANLPYHLPPFPGDKP